MMIYHGRPKIAKNKTDTNSTMHEYALTII